MNSGERVGVLGMGTWLVDHIKIVDKYPEEDTLCTILETKTAGGGCPYNVLKDLAKMNAPFPLYACGLLGDDSDAESIFCDCKNHGIDTSGFIKDPSYPTSFTDVMTAFDTGRRTFFHHRGSNDNLQARHVDLSKSGAKIFLEGYFGLLAKLDSCGENGENGHSALFREASERGFITCSDLVSANVDFKAITAKSLPHLDYLSVNELELQMLEGTSVPPGQATEFETLKKLADGVLSRGIRKFLIVHFKDGAYAFGSDGSVFKQGAINFPREFIKGTTGAGDAFYAGIICGVHFGWNMGECLKLGVCAAAQSLTSASASDGMLPWKECLSLADKYGFGNI